VCDRKGHWGPEDVTDEQRGWGKTVNFAQAYGQSPRGLMNRMLVLCDKVISEAEAEAWRRTFRRTYPQFAQWSDDRISMSDARRKIEISSGRFFEYSWGKPDAYHGNQAVNLPVQGTGADIGMHGLALIDERLRAANIKGGLVLWVHDEYLLEVATADASLTAEITENAMCDAFLAFLPNSPVKGIVSAKIGPSWSQEREQQTMPKIEHASDAAVVAGWKAHSATASRRGLRLCRDAAQIMREDPAA
jgi:DNA polymerase I-like protein with 3'-5' exonuclease and polymerase domains